MTNARNITDARGWSATTVRLSVVLLAIGVALMLAGAIWESARMGMLYTGGTIAAAGVAVGLVGVVGSWFRR